MNLASKYGYTPDKEAITRHIELIASGLEGMATPELYKQFDTPSPLSKL